MNVQVGALAITAGSRHRTLIERALPLSRESLRVRCYCILALTDAFAILAGCALGGAIRFGSLIDLHWLGTAAVLLPLFFVLALNGQAYTTEVLNKWRRGAAPALKALIAAAAFVLFASYSLRSAQEISRIMFGVSIAAAAMLLVVARAVSHLYVRRVLGGSAISVVLIRDGVAFAPISGPAVVDAGALGLAPDIGDPMMLDRLGRFLKGVDTVVVACPPSRRVAWAMVLKGANIRGEILMPEIGEIGGVGTGSIGGESTMKVSAGPLGLRSRAVKRALDLSFASAALVALAPLLLLTALAIRIEGQGPIFFMQNRVGRGNRLFKVFKFRSMRAEACDASGSRSTGRDDDRITRVGRFIRATSIDELPQILNIIRGDMSLVGPRPHALGSLAGDQLFWEVDKRYWQRHAIKPGLTGLAQVRGFRGATHARSDLTNRLQADLEYQSGWTIWRDVSIMLATLKVLIHKNAF